MKNHIESRYKKVIVLGTVFSLGAIGCGQQKFDGDKRAAEIRQSSKQYTDVEIVPEEFCQNTNKNPQLMYSKKPAKLIVNSLCQPPLGSPIGLFDEPNFKSKKTGEVKDGDIVTADCIEADGQTVTNVTGDRSASKTWVKVVMDQQVGFISEINVGYVHDADFKPC